MENLNKTRTTPPSGQETEKAQPRLISGHVQTCPFAKVELCDLFGNQILVQNDGTVIQRLHKLSLIFTVYAAAVGNECFNSAFWPQDCCSHSVS